MQLNRILTATLIAMSATLMLPAYGQTNITLVAYSGLF